METTGKLKVIGTTQMVSDKFSKRELVLTMGDTYPQHVSFQVTQDKCGLLDRFNVDDEVKVQFNLRGREWNGPQGVKYFNTLEAWRIELVTAGDTTNELNNDAVVDNLDSLPF